MPIFGWKTPSERRILKHYEGISWSPEWVGASGRLYSCGCRIGFPLFDSLQKVDVCRQHRAVWNENA